MMIDNEIGLYSETSLSFEERVERLIGFLDRLYTKEQVFPEAWIVSMTGSLTKVSSAIEVWPKGIIPIVPHPYGVLRRPELGKDGKIEKGDKQYLKLPHGYEEILRQDDARSVAMFNAYLKALGSPDVSQGLIELDTDVVGDLLGRLLFKIDPRSGEEAKEEAREVLYAMAKAKEFRVVTGVALWRDNLPFSWGEMTSLDYRMAMAVPSDLSFSYIDLIVRLNNKMNCHAVDTYLADSEDEIAQSGLVINLAKKGGQFVREIEVVESDGVDPKIYTPEMIRRAYLGYPEDVIIQGVRRFYPNGNMNKDLVRRSLNSWEVYLASLRGEYPKLE